MGGKLDITWALLDIQNHIYQIYDLSIVRYSESFYNVCVADIAIRRCFLLARILDIVKLRQGSGKDRQGMALKGKGHKA